MAIKVTLKRQIRGGSNLKEEKDYLKRARRNREGEKNERRELKD